MLMVVPARRVALCDDIVIMIVLSFTEVVNGRIKTPLTIKANFESNCKSPSARWLQLLRRSCESEKMWNPIEHTIFGAHLFAHANKPNVEFGSRTGFQASCEQMNTNELKDGERWWAAAARVELMKI